MCILKGVLHPDQKLAFFVLCTLSQNYQHLFWKSMYASYDEFSKELKTNIQI